MNAPFQQLGGYAAISVTELKKNPSAVIKAADIQPVAVLSHNKVVGYIVSPEAWEGILEAVDDLHIIGEINNSEGEEGIPVSLDDL